MSSSPCPVLRPVTEQHRDEVWPLLAHREKGEMGGTLAGEGLLGLRGLKGVPWLGESWENSDSL